MTAIELMVGDLLRKTKTGEVRIWSPSSYIYAIVSYYEPIPLTEEILKKNGFGKNFSERYTKGIVPFEVNIHGNNKYITLGGKHFCNCDYVHDLQHALRLCGLNDLADNLKV
ncbi:MAG: hypothetical protein KBT34_07330 [Prevotella sp.]|nr:hypothetical protein [Candidatus Prevotella equi]